MPFFITFIILLNVITNISFYSNTITNTAQAKISKVTTTTTNLTASNAPSVASSLKNDNKNNTTKENENEQAKPYQNHILVKVQHLKSKTRVYTLIAKDTTLEIAPGIRVDAWAYNGTIPGPTLKATEGDRVIIHFINKGSLPHTIHLHGDHPAKEDGVFEQVQPNGTYTYDFIAEPAGALMYHCHVSPVMQHVRNGLYGAFIVYPKTPLPPAREYVLVDGEYDTQNQLNPLPEYYFFNGYAEQYMNHPLPAKTNETVRIYLINAGLSPAYGMHIHGTLFKAYPSGIWENPPLRVQSWEVASGNTAILEAKWPWEGKFTFHFHGIPEERGAMGYFNVTNAKADAADGKDVAISKSIDMNNWQMNLTKSLQKANPNGKITATENTESHSTTSMNMDNKFSNNKENKGKINSSINNNNGNSIEVLIVKGASTKGNKAFSPNPLKIKVGTTVTWINNDNNIHTITSGKPNTPNAGELFDSGLTALIMPSKTFSYKFTKAGDFSYFCRLHPTMTGTIDVEP